MFAIVFVVANFLESYLLTLHYTSHEALELKAENYL